MPKVQSQEPKASAYVYALVLLARRELSEAQVRQRLARKGHPISDIDEAVARLKEERAIDDARVAAAIARTETAIRRRGRVRVRRQLESAGIAPDTAKRALDDVFGGIDDRELIEAALQKRLHGRERAVDEREYRRIYRFLLSQGFEPDRVAHVMRARRPSGGDDSKE